MRKLLVLQHVAHEPLGTLDPLLKKRGCRIRYINFGRDPNAEPSLIGYNGLVILGGPMGVYEADKHPHLNYEMKLIEEAIKKEIPVLGICLGAQLTAKVLGATVKLNKEMEIGWCNVEVTEDGKKDPVLKNFKAKERIFQLHRDYFTIPKGALHLASSEVCNGQAFRYGEKVYGFQFHLEVDQPMIHRWMKIAGNLKDVESTKGVTVEKILQETETHIERSLELSTETFNRFIDLFNIKERVVRVGSGR